MGKYDMRIVKMKLADCVSPDYNPRKISDTEFEKLKHSIRTYGYNDPIIVNQRNNHIVAGNQRHRALTELNKENHGKYTIIDVVLVDLSPNDEKTFNIGHNKIGGEFDGEKLEILLRELEEQNCDMSLTGFADEIEDVNLEEIAEEFDDDLTGISEPLYTINVRCVNQTQQDILFERLKQEGYNVKAMKY